MLTKQLDYIQYTVSSIQSYLPSWHKTYVNLFHGTNWYEDMGLNTRQNFFYQDWTCFQLLGLPCTCGILASCGP